MWGQLIDWVGNWQLITALICIVLGLIGLMIVSDIVSALVIWTVAFALIYAGASSSTVSREGFQQLVNEYAQLTTPCPGTEQKAKDLVRVATQLGRIPNHSFVALQASVEACAASQDLQALSAVVGKQSSAVADEAKSSEILRDLRAWAERMLSKTVSAQDGAR